MYWGESQYRFGNQEWVTETTSAVCYYNDWNPDTKTASGKTFCTFIATQRPQVLMDLAGYSLSVINGQGYDAKLSLGFADGDLNLSVQAEGTLALGSTFAVESDPDTAGISVISDKPLTTIRVLAAIGGATIDIPVSDHAHVYDSREDMTCGICGFDRAAKITTTAMYRLYHPNADCGSHHYIGSTEERDYLVSPGWHYEGIGWYGMAE